MSKLSMLEERISATQKVCKFCEGTGIVTKTEWVGDDDSYDVEKKCVCQEEIDWNYYKLSTLI